QENTRKRGAVPDLNRTDETPPRNWRTAVVVAGRRRCLVLLLVEAIVTCSDVHTPRHCRPPLPPSNPQPSNSRAVCATMPALARRQGAGGAGSALEAGLYPLHAGKTEGMGLGRAARLRMGWAAPCRVADAAGCAIRRRDTTAQGTCESGQEVRVRAGDAVGRSSRRRETMVQGMCGVRRMADGAGGAGAGTGTGTAREDAASALLVFARGGGERETNQPRGSPAHDRGDAGALTLQPSIAASSFFWS
ncbi:hypothetical protein C8R46DRAFT_1244896, partial [Mycena filopes]